MPWTLVAPRLNDITNISALVEYNGKLYGGTKRSEPSSEGGKLLEWDEAGSQWIEKVPMLVNANSIESLLVVDGRILATTGIYHGASLSDAGQLLETFVVPGVWGQVCANKYFQLYAYGLTLFNDEVYAGTFERMYLYAYDRLTPGWKDKAVFPNVPNPPPAQAARALAVYRGRLYMTTVIHGYLFEYDAVGANWIQVAGSWPVSTGGSYSLFTHDDGNGERLYTVKEPNGDLLRWNDAFTWGSKYPLASPQVEFAENVVIGGTKVGVRLRATATAFEQFPGVSIKPPWVPGDPWYIWKFQGIPATQYPPPNSRFGFTDNSTYDGNTYDFHHGVTGNRVFLEILSDVTGTNTYIRLKAIADGIDDLGVGFELINYDWYDTYPIADFQTKSFKLELSGNFARMLYDGLPVVTPQTDGDGWTGYTSSLFGDGRPVAPLASQTFWVQLDDNFDVLESELIISDLPFISGVQSYTTIPHAGAWELAAPGIGFGTKLAMSYNGYIYAGAFGVNGSALYQWDNISAWITVAASYGTQEITSLYGYNGDIFAGTEPDGMLLKFTPAALVIDLNGVPTEEFISTPQLARTTNVNSGLPAIPPEQEGDIRISLNVNDGYIDWILADRDVERDAGFETAIMLTLLTNKRADDNDILPDDYGDKGGWWGDSVPNVVGDQIGWKGWLLRREQTTDAVIARCKEYLIDGFQWMIDDNIVAGVEANVTRVDGILSAPNDSVLFIQLNFQKPGGQDIYYKFFYNWQAQIFRRGNV